MFAYGADATAQFEILVQMLGPDTVGYARVFGLLLQYLSDKEAAELGDVSGWKAQIRALLGEGFIGDWGQVDDVLELDFRRIMATIGRPDIASRFLDG